MMTTRHSGTARWVGMLGVALLAAACDGDSTGPTELQGNRIYGVDTSNRLVLFGSTSVGTPVSRTTITGLQSGEQILGVDFRPADGRLYAAGSSNRIYVIDTATAAATVVGTGFTPGLSSAAIGFDFNPVPDRIRTHAGAGQNLRLHPGTGALAFTDGTLGYAPGDPGAGSTFMISGTAYTNSVAGATTTTLYAIDSARDVLVTLASPNNGVMTTVGPLGVSTGDDVGFDVFPGSGTAYATLTSGGRSSLYTVNLATGQATLVGEIRGAGALRGIAVAP